MKVRNVLVFPAGTEIGLEIYRSLEFCKDVRVFGAGQAISNPAQMIFPNYYPLPSIREPGWVAKLVGLCQRLAIDFIFPAYDDVIVALHEVADQLPARLVSSTAETCHLTRRKSSTYDRLASVVRVPRTYPSIDHVVDYPVFVKPDRGQGSFGVAWASDEQSLRQACDALDDPLICEYLPGKEFTVDCFSDRDRGLLYAAPRNRLRIRNGIAVHTLTHECPESQEMASRISQALNMRGAWFFQAKRAADGTLALLEVAPRIAGSMATNRVRGVNFALLSIYEQERLPVSILAYPGHVEVDRALSHRYRHTIRYGALYIDLDDTLIFREQVNIHVMSLIFQALNRGCPVKLITRHRHDLAATLARYRLQGLFDQVIHITDGTPKSAFITERDAVLVDDSYAERLEVAGALGIHTFDCSMIELLIDSPIV